MTERVVKARASVSVFLSHTAADKPFARQLAHDLTEAGALVWLDEAELLLGDSLLDKIGTAIHQVDYLAVVLSPASVISPWVQKELEIAMTQEIRGRRVKVLPLLFKPCELPSFLQGKLYADFTQPHLYGIGIGLILARLGLSHDGHRAGTVLVYDLGGGTFDCSVVAVNPSYRGEVDLPKLERDLREVGLKHAREIDARRESKGTTGHDGRHDAE